MAYVMSLQEWKKNSDAGVLATRTPEIKAIDTALEQFHRSPSANTLLSLRKTIETWMAKEGPNWKNSPRNKGNVMDNLYRQSESMQGHKQTGEEMAALSAVRNESRAIVTDLFRDRKLVYKGSSVKKILSEGYDACKSIGSHVKTLKGSGGKPSPPSAAQPNFAFAEELFRQIVPTDMFTDVKSMLLNIMPDFMTQWAAELAPFTGIVKSGGTTMLKAADVVKTQWTISQSKMHGSRTLSIDEPAQAIEAIIRLLERERNIKLTDLGIAAAEFGGKLASLLVDMSGTVLNAAISIAAGVVKLVVLIGTVVRDVLESRAANALMSKGQLNASLFSACPIMGAYFLCCVPTSVIVNTIFSEDKFYAPGMQDKVEHAVKKHFKPLREQAQRFIKDHRLHIPELINFPGIVEVNKKNIASAIKRKGKTALSNSAIEGDGMIWIDNPLYSG